MLEDMMLPCHVGFGHPNDVCANSLCADHVVVVVFSGVAVSKAIHILEEDTNSYEHRRFISVLNKTTKQHQP
jgi:hypothetical protein